MSSSVIQNLFPTGNFILSHLHSNVDRLNLIAISLEDMIQETDTFRRKDLLEISGSIHQNIVSESRNLFETLSKNLITPFDREDIFAIGSGLKTMSSKTDSLIRFIAQNKCDKTRLGLPQLCRLFLKAVSALVDVIHCLDNISQKENTFKSLMQLRNIHEEIDNRCELFMAESFDTIDSIRDILINVDIYTYFSALATKLKELEQDTEGLIVKYG
jgi:uncharacterized protein Yka (UPF0111/DUF47 family)